GVFNKATLQLPQKQTSQVEVADDTFKAGNIDAELIVHVNQIGEGAEAASQAYTQKEARGDNVVFEAVTEVPSTAQDHSEDDVGDELKQHVEMEETFNLFHTHGHVILLNTIVQYLHLLIFPFWKNTKTCASSIYITHEQIHYNILLHETI
ncbi:hypothetical protein ACJX0J_011636, partial [Zea mays]